MAVSSSDSGLPLLGAGHRPESSIGSAAGTAD